MGFFYLLKYTLDLQKASKQEKPSQNIQKHTCKDVCNNSSQIVLGVHQGWAFKMNQMDGFNQVMFSV